MSIDDLRALLGHISGRAVGPTGPGVLGPVASRVYRAWSDAHEESERAWQGWRRNPGSPSYRAAYVAALDREDSAQDALAAANAR